MQSVAHRPLTELSEIEAVCLPLVYDVNRLSERKEVSREAILLVVKQLADEWYGGECPSVRGEESGTIGGKKEYSSASQSTHNGIPPAYSSPLKGRETPNASSVNEPNGNRYFLTHAHELATLKGDALLNGTSKPAADRLTPERQSELERLIGEGYFTHGNRAGKCRVCNTPLKDPVSLARGIGPCCRNKVGAGGR